MDKFLSVCNDSHQRARERTVADSLLRPHRTTCAACAIEGGRVPENIPGRSSNVVDPQARVVRDAFARAAHGLYLGHDDGGWRHVPTQQSVLVLGPPRSGKTSALVIPNVLGANGPVVTTSTKADVLDATKTVRRAVGACLLFDPTNSIADRPGVERLRWSPVPACSDWRVALSTARALVLTSPGHDGTSSDASHWTERAQALLAPLLHAAALDGADMRTVLTWVDRRQALPAQQVLAWEPAATPVARDVLEGVVATDDRERSGIWSTASGALAGFRSEEALAATSRPGFDADRFVASSDTVFVAAPAEHQALAAPLVVGLLSDIRRAAYARAARDGTDGPPVVLALDELANIAPLPELPAMVSEGGGQGLVLLACLQDLSQARRRWPTLADGFPSLFGATVVLPGIGDVRTLEVLSALAGDEEVVTRSRSLGRGPTGRPVADLVTGGRRHVGEEFSTRWQRRLPVDAIARGRDGWALAFDQRNRAGWIPLAPAHRAEPWRTLRGRERTRDRSRPAPGPLGIER